MLIDFRERGREEEREKEKNIYLLPLKYALTRDSPHNLGVP